MRPVLDIEALRERVIAELDPAKPDLAYCIFHDDQRSPNMRLYDDHVYCYACCTYADYAKALATILNPTDPNSILEQIYREYGIAVSPETLTNRLHEALAVPEYDDQLLVVSTEARLRRTSHNFAEIERELYLFDLEL